MRTCGRIMMMCGVMMTAEAVCGPQLTCLRSLSHY